MHQAADAEQAGSHTHGHVADGAYKLPTHLSMLDMLLMLAQPLTASMHVARVLSAHLPMLLMLLMLPPLHGVSMNGLKSL